MKYFRMSANQENNKKRLTSRRQVDTMFEVMMNMGSCISGRNDAISEGRKLMDAWAKVMETGDSLDETPAGGAEYKAKLEAFNKELMAWIARTAMWLYYNPPDSPPAEN